MIDSTAKMLAGQFFDKFAAVVGGEAAAAVPEATPDATMEPEVTQTRGGTAHAPVSRISPQDWIGIGALVVVVALLAFALLGN